MNELIRINYVNNDRRDVFIAPLIDFGSAQCFQSWISDEFFHLYVSLKALGHVIVWPDDWSRCRRCWFIVCKLWLNEQSWWLIVLSHIYKKKPLPITSLVRWSRGAPPFNLETSKTPEIRRRDLVQAAVWVKPVLSELPHISDLTKMRLTFSPHYLSLSNTETHSDRLKGMKWLTGEKNNEKLTPKSTRWRDRANSTALISPPLNNKHIWSIFALPVPVSTFCRGGAYPRFCLKIKNLLHLIMASIHASDPRSPFVHH